MGNQRKLSLLAFYALHSRNSRVLHRIPSIFASDFRSSGASDRQIDFLSGSTGRRRRALPESMALWRSLGSSEFAGGGGEGEGEAPRCWNCAASAPSPGPYLSCELCRSVQPVDDSVDYFQIFGLTRKYDIGDCNLEGKYKDWQKKLHPDLVHSKSEKEKAFAVEQSARVIDAYRTLSRPLPRAFYLLKLESIHVDEEKTVTDPELLAEMMDIREAVEEADDPQSLQKIKSLVEGKFEAWSSCFQQAFQKRDFDNAVSSIHGMKYYERAIEELVKKL